MYMQSKVLEVRGVRGQRYTHSEPQLRGTYGSDFNNNKHNDYVQHSQVCAMVMHGLIMQLQVSFCIAYTIKRSIPLYNVTAVCRYLPSARALNCPASTVQRFGSFHCLLVYRQHVHTWVYMW